MYSESGYGPASGMYCGSSYGVNGALVVSYGRSNLSNTGGIDVCISNAPRVADGCDGSCQAVCHGSRVVGRLT